MPLCNYLTDLDLRPFFPDIADNVWDSQQDYSPQLDKALDRLIDDLYNISIEPRLVMPMLDLKLASTATDRTIPLTSTTETSSTTGSAFVSTNQRRFVINVSAHSGATITVKLQGSNAGGVDNTTVPEASWEDVPNASFTIEVADDNGEQSKKFMKQYKYYRYISTISSGSITYTLGLVEAVFDNLLAWNALNIIFTSWSKEEGDIWDRRAQLCEKKYLDGITGLKYSYDGDADNSIENEVYTPGFTIGLDR